MPNFRATRPTLMSPAESRSLLQEAMAACSVRDADNRRVFMSEIVRHQPADVLECLQTFLSERRQGEHANARNLAAVLMTRLKALP